MSRACCQIARSTGAAFCGACGRHGASGRREAALLRLDALAAAALFLALSAAAVTLPGLVLGPGRESRSSGADRVVRATAAPSGALSHGDAADVAGAMPDPSGSFRAPAAGPTSSGGVEPPPRASSLGLASPPGVTSPLPLAGASLPLPISEATASSSSRSTSGGTSYGPWNAVDGRRETGWQVSDGGPGEWIRLGFSGEVRLDRVGIVPGYDKRLPDRFGDRWPLNNRVAAATIEWEGGARAISLRDDRAMQWTDLGGVSTSWVRVSLEAVRAGSRWNDTILSEIECSGAAR